jgi:exodeoxyribonuclease VII large subunit
VVSAIGHEPDQPLLDLVADRRAATPTDAAKTVVPDVAEEADRIDQARARIRGVLRTWLAQEQRQLDSVRARPALADPARGLDDRTREVQELRDRTRRCLRHRVDRATDDLDHTIARVRSLSPLATLERGYSVVQDAQGHVVASVSGVDRGAALQVRVADGRLGVTVDRTQTEEEIEGD